MPVINKTAAAIGTINGTNADFSTPTAYVPGSLQVFYNGQWKQAADDDGFTETGATTFTMKEVPFTEDNLLVAYEESA